MIREVKQYPELAVPTSRIGSYLAWRSIIPGGKLKPPPLNEDGVCMFCGGTFEPVIYEKYGKIRCLCDIWNENKRLEESLRPYRAMHTAKILDDFVIWGKDPLDRQVLQETLEHLRTWIRWPDSWILLYGNPGTGKTHLLTAIADYFHPWSLYLTASDFEQLVFSGLQDDTLGQQIDTIKHAPILVFDDLGAEYVGTGKEFVRANLRKIIDFRYQMWEEYPTVIASNRDVPSLEAYDMRIADRLLDKAKVAKMQFQGESWRRHGDKG
jgi:DNA replication protein DnaC